MLYSSAQNRLNMHAKMWHKSWSLALTLSLTMRVTPHPHLIAETSERDQQGMGIACRSASPCGPTVGEFPAQFASDVPIRGRHCRAAKRVQICRSLLKRCAEEYLLGVCVRRLDEPARQTTHHCGNDLQVNGWDPSWMVLERRSPPYLLKDKISSFWTFYTALGTQESVLLNNYQYCHGVFLGL